MVLIKSMKNLNDPIGNGTRHFRTCSTVPRTTAPRRAIIIVPLRSLNCIDSRLDRNSHRRPYLQVHYDVPAGMHLRAPVIYPVLGMAVAASCIC
jgi:hypothetical protein